MNHVPQDALIAVSGEEVYDFKHGDAYAYSAK
jgi:hypothetical protein